MHASFMVSFLVLDSFHSIHFRCMERSSQDIHKKRESERHYLIFTQTHPVSDAPPSRLCRRCPSLKERSAHTAVPAPRRRETWLTAPACPRPEHHPSRCPVPLGEPPPGHWETHTNIWTQTHFKRNCILARNSLLVL